MSKWPLQNKSSREFGGSVGSAWLCWPTGPLDGPLDDLVASAPSAPSAPSASPAPRAVGPGAAVLPFPAFGFRPALAWRTCREHTLSQTRVMICVMFMNANLKMHYWPLSCEACLHGGPQLAQPAKLLWQLSSPARPAAGSRGHCQQPGTGAVEYLEWSLSTCAEQGMKWTAHAPQHNSWFQPASRIRGSQILQELPARLLRAFGG